MADLIVEAYREVWMLAGMIQAEQYLPGTAPYETFAVIGEDIKTKVDNWNETTVCPLPMPPLFGIRVHTLGSTLSANEWNNTNACTHEFPCRCRLQFTLNETADRTGDHCWQTK
jgi:hypothetical protein